MGYSKVTKYDFYHLRIYNIHGEKIQTDTLMLAAGTIFVHFLFTTSLHGA